MHPIHGRPLPHLAPSLFLLLFSLTLLLNPLFPSAFAAESTPSPSAPKHPSSPHFDPDALTEIQGLLQENINKGEFPGALYWLEHQGQSVVRMAGRRAVKPKSEPLSRNTLFDLASLTKVVATTPSVMILVERGKIGLDARVSNYIPTFVGEGREGVTVRHLLTHTSGLRPGLPRQPAWEGGERAIELACAEKLQSEPGSKFVYSDINFILLGEIVKRVSGLRLDVFAEREVFGPLKMNSTQFVPSKRMRSRIAPTEKVGDSWLRGEVHDPTSRLMGGVAGHAGLFSTIDDLSRYARMMLGGGELEGVRILKEETVRMMTSVQTAESAGGRRGLGWDIDTGYSRPRGRVFPLGSYGHTGFTGTCLWIDPFSKSFWILLSSRLHPDGKGNVLGLQSELGTVSARAIRGFDFQNVPGSLKPRPGATLGTPTGVRSASAPVLQGIDVLVRDEFRQLRGLRVGLITNHTGKDRLRRSTIDLLQGAAGVELKALFSPEHGIRGALDEKVADGRDELTGLPVYSLYGERRAPEMSQLAGLDALVFDVQDIGCRFYTYIATLGNCLEMASKAGLRFVVLDRVNPVNGLTVEGPVHALASTFVAYHPIPLRHGMTVGELAGMFCAERKWDVRLTVVKVEGWKRSMWMDETGLPWSHPSPNMRSMNGAALYPGLGLHEAALSVGRGTDVPFQLLGAPYVNDVLLASELSQSGLVGLRFLPVRFRPTYSTFKGRECGGVAVVVTDREQMSPVDLGIELAVVLRRVYPREFDLEKMRSLLTDEGTMKAVAEGQTLEMIKAGWKKDLQAFSERRAKFLLY